MSKRQSTSRMAVKVRAVVAQLQNYTVNDRGCWEYQGAISASGYGNILNEVAHRFFWKHLVGEIPADMHLDHLCMNKVCVNPAHLEPVTASENNRRAREARGVGEYQTECPNGHAWIAENIFVRSATAKRPGKQECRLCMRDRKRARRAERLAVVEEVAA